MLFSPWLQSKGSIKSMRVPLEGSTRVPLKGSIRVIRAIKKGTIILGALIIRTGSLDILYYM